MLVSLAKSESLTLNTSGEFDQALADLQSATGPAFDRAYAKLMVDVHVRALTNIDESTALNETPVGAFAQVVRTRVADGLDKAKQL